jgi:hypothetical protein
VERRKTKEFLALLKSGKTPEGIIKMYDKD